MAPVNSPLSNLFKCHLLNETNPSHPFKTPNSPLPFSALLPPSGKLHNYLGIIIIIILLLFSMKSLLRGMEAPQGQDFFSVLCSTVSPVLTTVPGT